MTKKEKEAIKTIGKYCDNHMCKDCEIKDVIGCRLEDCNSPDEWNLESLKEYNNGE